jgi:hypothetical protein
MRVELNGWQQFGIVLSIIWFVGFATWGWTDAVEELRQNYKEAISTCRTNSLRFSGDGTANAAEYKECRDKESAQFANELDKNSRHLPILLVVDLITIIFAWAVIWVIVDTVRWARRHGHL